MTNTTIYPGTLMMASANGTVRPSDEYEYGSTEQPRPIGVVMRVPDQGSDIVQLQYTGGMQAIGRLEEPYYGSNSITMEDIRAGEILSTDKGRTLKVNIGKRSWWSKFKLWLKRSKNKKILPFMNRDISYSPKYPNKFYTGEPSGSLAQTLTDQKQIQETLLENKRIQDLEDQIQILNNKLEGLSNPNTDMLDDAFNSWDKGVEKGK